MRIEQQEIEYAINKAQELSEYHKLKYLGHDNPIKSIDDLTEICTDYLNKKVKCLEHPMPSDGSYVKGFFVAYDSEYEIVLLSGLNPCWLRLVKTKELFHVVMDKEEYRNPSIAELINEVRVSFPVYDSQPATYAASEFLTEIAAMEYLFPYTERVSLLNQLNNVNLDFYSIALSRKLPRILIEKYLSGSMMAALEPYYTKK